MRLACVAVLGLTAVVAPSAQRGQTLPMNTIAERYVKLVLAVGQHDADYVDAYYGPPEWKADAERQKAPLAQIATDAERLIAQIPALSAADRGDELVVLRRDYLRRQLEALQARVRMLEGAKLTFDEESRALYDASAPVHPESYFAAALEEIDRQLPGRSSQGTLVDRYDAFRQQFVIPADRLTRVFDRAIAEMPAPDAPARPASRGRELHRRVRQEQAVERLQLVPGQLSQPDPGQHRPADLHRSRRRSRVPRGIPGTPRLQRAARTASRSRSRLGGVLDLRLVLAAVADRRRHRELRHRGGVSRRRADDVRARRAVPGSRAGSLRRPPPTRGSRRWSIASPTPAMKRRGNI